MKGLMNITTKESYKDTGNLCYFFPGSINEKTTWKELISQSYVTYIGCRVSASHTTIVLKKLKHNHNNLCSIFVICKDSHFKIITATATTFTTTTTSITTQLTTVIFILNKLKRNSLYM